MFDADSLDRDFTDQIDFGSSSPPVHVFYHASCADGFCAAWQAWRILGGDAIYQPVQYGRDIPYTELGARVYILDFSFPRDVLLDLAERSEKVILLDHHKSAEADLAGLEHPNLEIIFDQTRSGAMLAWEYFHRDKTNPDLKPPLIVSYVQDRDLWTWELPGSRAFSAALKLVPLEFQAWEYLSLMLDEDSHTGRAYSEDFFRRGKAIVESQNVIIKGLCDKAFKAPIAGHAVPCVNSPSFQSEIGDELCQRHPESEFAAIWFAPDMTSRIYSLRSRNGFDVSEVARLFGGGGHAAAASFRVDNDRPISRSPASFVPEPES